jgi:pyridoxamine 5'-phosphate oxidase-like protein
MGVLTQDMRDILASAMLAFVATVRRDGSPSLSPKASTIPYDDDHLLFVDIVSPQTIANLRNDIKPNRSGIFLLAREGSGQGDSSARAAVEAKTGPNRSDAASRSQPAKSAARFGRRADCAGDSGGSLTPSPPSA